SDSGRIATPSPTIFRAKTGSGTSVSGTVFPLKGAWIRIQAGSSDEADFFLRQNGTLITTPSAFLSRDGARTRQTKCRGPGDGEEARTPPSVLDLLPPVQRRTEEAIRRYVWRFPRRATEAAKRFSGGAIPRSPASPKWKMSAPAFLLSSAMVRTVSASAPSWEVPRAARRRPPRR